METTNSQVQETLSLNDLDCDIVWDELYPVLLGVVRNLVFSFKVAAWRGQEEDIAEDVVQEAAQRMIERLQQAQRGEKPPVQSARAMIFTIARNHCHDLRRHDLRIERTPLEALGPTSREGASATLTDIAVENAFQEGLFLIVAQEIVHFPCKSSQAILIDLGSRRAFDEEPTSLQNAFLKAGIQLSDYQDLLSDHVRERQNHSANLYYAYKRLAQSCTVREYVAAS